MSVQLDVFQWNSNGQRQHYYIRIYNQCVRKVDDNNDNDNSDNNNDNGNDNGNVKVWKDGIKDNGTSVSVGESAKVSKYI